MKIYFSSKHGHYVYTFTEDNGTGVRLTDTSPISDQITERFFGWKGDPAIESNKPEFLISTSEVPVRILARALVCFERRKKRRIADG